jgi:aminoglycoside phosphotransferase family enzyme
MLICVEFNKHFRAYIIVTSYTFLQLPLDLLFIYELTGHWLLTYLRWNLLFSEVRDAFISVFVIA